MVLLVQFGCGGLCEEEMCLVPAGTIPSADMPMVCVTWVQAQFVIGWQTASDKATGKRLLVEQTVDPWQ